MRVLAVLTAAGAALAGAAVVANPETPDPLFAEGDCIQAAIGVSGEVTDGPRLASCEDPSAVYEVAALVAGPAECGDQDSHLSVEGHTYCLMANLLPDECYLGSTDGTELAPASCDVDRTIRAAQRFDGDEADGEAATMCADGEVPLAYREHARTYCIVDGRT
ncbi:hypothetical protein DW322_00265 [Rhodococcus rhodnii]|uniref:Pyridine nucleotide-disulfide oxidoreductase n=1 Tax=Rhodococcus rhodnii TaxID=38312 RepID=A0A6P2CBC4_9NOCA|nr:hypothetical protein DW322_00265 [Rhodococcus rhodnii]